MSNITTIKVGRKSYDIAFDFKSIKFATEFLNYNSYGDIQKEFLDLGFENVENDLSFPQYEFLAKFICAVIKANPENKAANLKKSVLEEFLFNHLDVTMDVLTAYSNAVMSRMGKLIQNQPQPQA
jgi:hypothetical protein